MTRVTFAFSDRHVEKESLADYIGKKREMFLVQVRVLALAFHVLHRAESLWTKSNLQHTIS